MQVPVLRDVQHMSFADIEGAISHYGKKAASGSLTSETERERERREVHD